MVVPLPNRWSPVASLVPQRRRVVILGATEAGLACAFHLGESALLIDQENLDGGQVTFAPNGVKRWELPQLTAEAVTTASAWNHVWRSLTSLTKGETRLGVRATAIHVYDRRLEISSGESFVYDKLVSALRLTDLQPLITDKKPSRLNSGESWGNWLNARDIELLDQSTQEAFGDIDGQAAGARVAESIRRAMAVKYSTKSAFQNRSAGLFHPKIVTPVSRLTI